MIYFIHNHDAGTIKIGSSDDPWKRLRQLQTGSSSRLDLFAVIPGGLSGERDLQSLFGRFKVIGEWFQDRPILHYFKDRLIGSAIVALPELNERGVRDVYRKPIRELSIEEAGKHLDCCKSIVRKNQKMFDLYHKHYTGRYGAAIESYFGFMDE